MITLHMNSFNFLKTAADSLYIFYMSSQFEEPPSAHTHFKI